MLIQDTSSHLVFPNYILTLVLSRYCSQRRAYGAMDLYCDIRSGYKIKNQRYRGARGGDQLQEEDGHKMDD